eukprot:366340-Chlamydomonas_euryale.AAC.4
MDGSITRRGQPCWYKQSKVGLLAVNDGILLEAQIYRTIKKHLKGHPSYLEILELFHDVTFQTAHGQLLDVTTAPIGTVDLTKYTLDNYMMIVTYKVMGHSCMLHAMSKHSLGTTALRVYAGWKTLACFRCAWMWPLPGLRLTAYYSFYMPVACGMLLAGISDPAAYKVRVAEDILVEMGQYFQIQDDYLDAFGDPDTIGKVGTDIEDNKCSWLICTCLKEASDAQKETIKANYGKKDKECVVAIKQIYQEINVEERFKEYEAESYKKLVAAIDAQTVLPKAVFTSLLSKIYKRKK